MKQTAKRWLAIAMAASMMFATVLTGCGDKAPAEDTSTEQTVQEESKEDKKEETAEKTEDKAEDKKEEAVPGESENKADEDGISLALLKGPTSLGALDLMEANENGESTNHYNITLAGAPDEVVAKVVSGEVDIAAVPTNLASVLYNKTQGNVQLAALNTLGVLNILEAGDTIHSVQDLKGKTIYATGQGATPEYALNMILEKNGLTPGEDVEIIYKSEHAEIAPLLASGEATIALLPHPFATAVLTQNDKVRIALDLTEEWDKAVNGESAITTGCIVVQKKFAEEHKEELDSFLTEYSESIKNVTSEEGIGHAAELSEKYDIIKKPIAQKAIPHCNIVFIEGDEMQKIASGFLQVLFDANPKAVGGKLPDDNFYYKR